ncbi:hypothetical protein [Arcobacter aquimarinus]|uniref:Uncharacterized protein n=1 Tax=Arcobacter aquimarinus TaxID=1315211 RepID=A0AAE7E1U3_9BACT|nr:hypothetical protein [Arcobacter aquimarinus]QKE27010.1 hypothetical protein AAQM_2311 [Arcobacter aquimarinus]RXI36923.1 hypothetical protein CP986_00285 [Arcobacter aquimarinus]
MFTQKKKAYYSKILGFKTIEDFEMFSKRYLKYLENQTLTKNRIMSGFFILVEIQKEAHKNKSLINFDNVKNPFIKKYANEILDLRKNGSGSLSITNFLFENHRVKISRGTIEKFYKQNGL